MFRITKNTLRIFTLGEVLVMAALNQAEATRTHLCEPSQSQTVQWETNNELSRR
jgi:hypothetical protein